MNTTDLKTKYIPVSEVAESLHVNVSTVYRWLDGDTCLEDIRVGKRRHVSKESLIAYLGKDVAEKIGLIEPMEA